MKEMKAISHYLGPSLVESEKEAGPRKWRVIAFTFDPPLIGYGSTLEDALDHGTGQIAYKRVETNQEYKETQGYFSFWLTADG
jgi:hypothetical protein